MVGVVLCSAVGTVLIAAALAKVGRHEQLARVVAGYELVGWRTSRLVARVLPPVELVVGAALVLGVAAPLPATAAAALLAGFTAALAVNRLRGRTELACGCFRDERPHPLTWLRVGRPAALALAALAGTALAAPAPAGPASTSDGLVLATVAGAGLAVAVLAGTATARLLDAETESAPPSAGYLAAARLVKESR